MYIQQADLITRMQVAGFMRVGRSRPLTANANFGTNAFEEGGGVWAAGSGAVSCLLSFSRFLIHLASLSALTVPALLREGKQACIRDIDWLGYG